ncbi:GNAT family N-acetyltransferase [Kitasatospora sp. NPDC051984]|uniref:GNAT family N-acetyltransferase n=1 Tax=Kitasatospora sp. NPDC051984 TaxID=3364059 RepID=UPI0037C5D396
MTTTLRPDGAEEAAANDGRTRRWHIMVNGHPVGGLRTTAWPGEGFCPGEISELEVTEGRRRGRGTVAALAAEEVLRSWGCTRVDITVPADAEAGLRLAHALGYVERMRNMIKPLDELPQLPAGLTDRRIGPEQYPAWEQAAVAGYRQDLIDSGLGAAEATAKSEHDHQRALPDGPDTPDTALRQLLDADGNVLGCLWVALRLNSLPDGRPLAWVMLVEVAPEQRGHGHGRTLMRLAERECLAAGVHDLGLNVFSDNGVAVALYESLGYRVTLRRLSKSLL